MFPSKPLTLLFYITLTLALAANANHAPHRRDHVNLNRIIRKRAGTAADTNAADPLPSLVGGGDTTASANNTATASGTSSSAATSLTTSSLLTALTSQTSVTSATTSGSLSSSSSSTSSTVTTSTAATTSATLAPNPVTTSASLNLAPASSKEGTTARVTVTSTSSAGPTTTGQAADDATTSSTGTHTTRTVFIVIGASVGAVAVIWTIIRKWKFKPSSHFEDRMQPIDWQPTTGDDGGIPVHRRAGSAASSFHSAGHDNVAGRGVGGYGAEVEAPPLNPIPDHDFTPGAANLAPVGGYADLARGPSPQPPMQDLSQGPMHRPMYEQYGTGVPLHRQTGYAPHDAYDYNGAAVRY